MRSSGHMAMEASIANVLEPGEKILVGENGIWGTRVCDLAARYNLEVVSMKKPAGETYSLEELKAALDQHKPQGLFLCQVCARYDPSRPFVNLLMKSHAFAAVVVEVVEVVAGHIEFFPCVLLEAGVHALSPRK